MMAKDEAKEAAPVRKSRLRWFWKVPALALGGLVALICAAVLLGISIWLLILAITAVGALPLRYVLAVIAAVPAAVAFGAVAAYLDASSHRRWGFAALAPVVVAAAYLLGRQAYFAAQNHPIGTILLITLDVIVAWVLAVLWIPDEIEDHLVFAGGPALALVIALALGTALGDNVRDQGALNDYCSYGAVSSAQLQGCLDHVTLDQIRRLNTDAARFAKGEMDTCLPDAGPFCAQAKINRDYTPDQQ